ncbi:zinc finger and SCAN domain-containing protein 2-like isoform X2 [Syngnathoides biaculeatus]|uniref:zinc finger and SCAN domain-containing protein 2-like isoform X2 n=1 Tax=Syngnathoides biaculeatus TaxID=300417 RepID=UPI002ADD3376|nr:zinc finger and SCAN domain-containing protein 2-like isoform X2 [Syngnathoides biaculeatus]
MCASSSSVRSMACVAFQTQLSSILEVLVKAAVAEISKLVDDNSAFLHLEISRKQSENEMLKRKLLAVEKKNAHMQRMFENLVVDRGSDGGNAPHPAGEIKCPEMEDANVSFTIKEESPDEVLWISDPATSGSSLQYQNVSEGFEEDRQKTASNFADSFASGERGGEASGLHLLVKTEKEETACQLGPTKQNQLAHLCLDERDHQLWSSIIDGDDIDSAFPDFSSVVDEYSDVFPEQPRKSGSISHQPSQAFCNSAYDGEDPASSAFPPRPQSDLRKEQLYPQRRPQVEEPLDEVAAMAHCETTHRPFPRGFACAQCGKTFSRLHQFKLHQQNHKRKRAFWCAVCGKGFQCSSHLSIHHRTHTGEKPYACLQCGKRFTQQSSLRVHQRTHSGERPYNCTQCGKTFILMHHLKRHCVIHTYG